MKLDILAFGAHPDDVELSCSGTLLKEMKNGKKVGLVDLTRGELGTRGSADIRDQEARDAAEILGVEVRHNLDLGDGWFEINQANKLKIIEVIRRHQPKTILINAVDDRHIDHPRGGQLVKEAAFLAGLGRIETQRDGVKQERWRPPVILHYAQYFFNPPTFVVDITDYFDQKMDSIKAYKSQFFDPNSKEPSSVISSEDFMQAVISRAREVGNIIPCTYGEGFIPTKPFALDSISELG